ncbi:WW domain-containing transcription regulator protein 1 [Chelonia mydas]|uniref:WW domain-containing transcription regulator protein 1 n=1 Tax=Chelonia mydas TaxID=8469 RepID=M7BJB1_CHEMY|nr:WW domain-containing transcription regulator protein 1 [Chelonia mydas]
MAPQGHPLSPTAGEAAMGPRTTPPQERWRGHGLPYPRNGSGATGHPPGATVTTGAPTPEQQRLLECTPPPPAPKIYHIEKITTWQDPRKTMNQPLNHMNHHPAATSTPVPQRSMAMSQPNLDVDLTIVILAFASLRLDLCNLFYMELHLKAILKVQLIQNLCVYLLNGARCTCAP